MEIIGNIFAGIFTVIGAFLLFFLFAILVTIGIGMYIWHRVKKQARTVLQREFGDFQGSLDETIIDVEVKDKK